MSENHDSITVKNNTAAGRWEAEVNGELAFAQYTTMDNNWVFTHTEVPPALEGRGLGGTIVRTALEQARTEHKGVVPLCPFVRSYIQRHQEYVDLVDPAFRSRVEPNAR